MMMQLAGQRKREDTSDSALSSFSGLRPSYW